MSLPPHLEANDKVILFDGVCRLCNGWVRFLLKYDTHATFKLCSVQSPEGQDILAFFGFPTDTYETVLLVEGSRVTTRSEAVLRVMRQLPRPWRFLAVFRVIPRSIRDWFYDRIARNRYRIFGRYDQCMVPPESSRERFLGRGDRKAKAESSCSG